MKKIWICSILSLSMLLSLSCTLVSAQNESVDFEKLYMELAQEADQNPYGDFLATSGLILIDLNKDTVPELLTFSSSAYHYDENGNQLFAYDENYDDATYKSTEHFMTRAFSIIDGKIVEDSPWVEEYGTVSLGMNFLPGEDAVDTEALCMPAQYLNHDCFFSYAIPSTSTPNVWALWYENGHFDYCVKDYSALLNDAFYYIDLPVASIEFYDENTNKLRTKSEAMQIALQDYNVALSTAAYDSPFGDQKPKENKVSDWAIGEVNEAEQKNLIPREMLDDNLVESISRAEFAAIAITLLEKTTGREYKSDIECPFDDISDNKYSNYIRKAWYASITTGTSDTSFDPDMSITREQLSTMLCRVIKSVADENYSIENDSVYPLNISGVEKFEDDSQISDYARESVYYMSKSGITKGVDETHFAPLLTATKEQAILLALRIFDLLEK